MGKKRKVKHSIVVETTPELAFEAVTKASELREWFCDEAWTEVRPGGRYDVRWNQGYRSDGKFLAVDAPSSATVTWQGSGEPGETKIKFTVSPVEDGAEQGVEIKVVHRGFGPGSKWDAAVEEAERGWTSVFENLKSALETGIDLRAARRPFLGINLDLLTPERAEKEGIAAERGIYVLGAVEGSGAEAAGLGQSDVILSLGGAETPGYQELGAALAARKAGDVVDVEVVRGQTQETIQVTLGTRPQAEAPGSAAELADRLAKLQADTDAELRAALEGVSEEEASQQPAEGEWSAKQVLAHLTSGERAFHTLFASWAVNGWLDGAGVDPDDFPGQLTAVLTVTPTLEGLVERFITDEAETVALMRHLPEETVAHKARFRRISEFALFGPMHTQSHIDQIKAAIEAARS